MTVIDPSVMMAGGGCGTLDFLYFDASSYVNVPVSASSAGNSVNFRYYTFGNPETQWGFKSKPMLYSVAVPTQSSSGLGMNYNIAWELSAQDLSEAISDIVHTNYVGNLTLELTILGTQTSIIRKDVSASSDGDGIDVLDAWSGTDRASSNQSQAKLMITDFNIPW